MVDTDNNTVDTADTADNESQDPPSRKGSIRRSLGLVTGTLKFARAYSDVDLNRTERQLEEEIRRESCVPPPHYRIARLRHRGEQVLHSKHVLLVVVILNLIDCALVLGELVLDINYIKELRENSELSSQTFINAMEARYPDVLYNHNMDDMSSLFEKLYQANCYWNDTSNTAAGDHSAGAEGLSFFEKNEHISRRNAPEYYVYRGNGTSGNNDTAHARQYPDADHVVLHSIWVEIAHGMHKASITILGVLFVENILKVMFMGRSFFVKRLEMFDATIVILSFIIDLVFLKGLTGYRVQDALLILSFLLPWRVIRVVNSLIVAVLDQEHFRLKMVYREKKAIAAELKILKEKDKKWDFHLQKIEKFCESEGIPKWKIRQHTAMGRKQSTITSMASLALNGLLTGMMTGPEDNHLFARSMSMMKQDSAASSLGNIVEDDDDVIDDVRLKHDAPDYAHSSAEETQLSTVTEVGGSSEEKNNNGASCHQTHLTHLHPSARPAHKRVSFDDAERKPLLRQNSVDDPLRDRQSIQERDSMDATGKNCGSNV